jgi:uncharacterized membrane protein HdeD (DUF308 family)
MANMETSARSRNEHWLTRYYLVRGAFSLVWVASALTLGQHNPPLEAVLLTIYPLWDAAANYVDAARNGGLRGNRTQALNSLVSLVTAAAVIAAVQVSPGAVLAVFGAWAILAGLLQLGTAVRRWKSAGAQWAMVLSGGQSALAGAFFILQAQRAVAGIIPTIAGYAAFGAIYFIVSALWPIAGKRLRRQS